MSQETVKLIEKFLAGTLSEKEMQELLNAYQQKQISEKQFEEYYAHKWKDAMQYPSSLAEESKQRAWKQFQLRMRQNTPTPLRNKKKWVAYTSVAAVAILFFMLGISLHQLHNHSRQELIVMVENGQKASVQLPDGSSVRLNSASELRYSPDFGKKNRTVKLVGEAYFDVESNPDNPFIVLTHANLQVKALGTKFNIKSYPGDEQIIGTLIEGKIEVSNPIISEVLNVNDRITYHTKEMTFTKSSMNNPEEAIFWMTNQFVFKEETLENIAKILERTYNVTIAFASPDIKDIKYSGKIKNNSMENVLNLITVVSPLQYTMNESHITFSQR